MKSLLLFYSFSLLFCYTSCTQESAAKKQSEKWVTEHIFPYFDSARFLTEEENALYGIDNNLKTYVPIESYSTRKGYLIEGNNTHVPEDTLYNIDLYDYFEKEYKGDLIYLETLENQIYQYLGPIKNTIYLGPPTEEIPAEIRQKFKMQEKVTYLLDNAQKIYYSGTGNTSDYSKSQSKFYTYKLYFSFMNSYTKDSSQMVILPMIIHLDEEMNVLNKKMSLYDCDNIK